MTTITNNKLPDCRTALDKCVENYQSTRAWYEENRDSPAALDDMERAEDQLANFVRKCGFSIVLGLLDEIDELQDRRRAEHCTSTVLGSLLESEIMRLVGKEQPVPVVPEKMSKHALFEVAISRFSKMNEGFPIKRFKADWVISWMLENFPPVAQKQGDN
ncbi:hypothetical protein KNC47_004201 [Salmonella enterica]|nr:hypothetical protein [Salmonella enterica]